MSWETPATVIGALGIIVGLGWRVIVRIENRLDNVSERLSNIEGQLKNSGQMGELVNVAIRLLGQTREVKEKADVRF